MRRIIAGLVAFVAVTTTLLTLPVYAAPGPEAHPVEASLDEVELGSVVEPERGAVVATDGEVHPGGVEESEATATPSPSSTAEPAGEGADQPAPSAGASSTAPAGDDEVPTSGAELPGVPALTVSRPETDPFSSVGVTWRSDPAVTDVVVQVRVRGDDGWSEWTALEADDIEQTETSETEDNDVRGGTAPYWTGPADGVEVVVQSAGGAVPEDVRLTLIDPGTSDADVAPASAGVQDQAHAGAAMPTIIRRAQWGADESIRTWDPEYAPTLKAATIHHSADGNAYSAADVPAIMRSIYTYHTKTRAWGDIGYNVIVDKFGRIFEGRYGGVTSTVVGAHAGGFNTGTFGVSMLGNYAEVDTPEPMLSAVADVIAWKLGLYGVDPNGQTQLTSGGGGTSRYTAGQVVTLPTVFAHRDVGNTTCPGQYAYNRMTQVRSMVSARMASSVGGSPIGNVEKFSITGSTVTVGGWTLDPDYPPGSIDVGMLVDGVTAAQFTASQSRPDVAAAMPGAGPSHGFSGTFTLSKGVHSVCAVAVNAAPTGLNTWLKCVTMTATAAAQPTTIPFGNVETATVEGRTLSVRGWTIDPDALSQSLDVHAYVNGGWGGQVVADRDRPDVGAVYPSAGPAHGFTWSGTVSAPGPYELCFYAINRNAGTTNPQLGCRTVTVSGSTWDPKGNLERATVTARTATLTGWALDGDTPTSPVAVHVYLDGRYTGQFTADRSRPDVGQVHAGTGSSHGFSGDVALPPGQHTLCAYAINTGYGDTNPQLGCLPVGTPATAWDPLGSLDEVIGSAGVFEVRGWAWDPDRGTAASDVHVYVDGRWALATTAGGNRPDVAAVYPAAGPAHGWAVTLRLSPGQHQVCAYGINTGTGTTNPLLACRTVTG